MASTAGARIDDIRRMYHSGVITEQMARNMAAPVICSMNKKKINRERNSGRDPKLFTFEQLVGAV